MSDTTTNTEGTPVAVAPVTTAETFSLDYVQTLRQEAAKYRTEKNDAVTAAKDSVDRDWATKVTGVEEKSSALEAELGDAWVYAAKIEAAVAAGVPSDKLLAFVQILKGSDQATIDASVESARALFGGFSTAVRATDPTQGSGSIPALGLNSDDLLNSVKSKLGIQ